MRADKNRTEIGVSADQHPAFRACPLENKMIARAREADLVDMLNVVARRSQHLGLSRRQVLVEQKPHAGWRSGNSRSRTAAAV